MNQVTPNIGDAFGPVKKARMESSIPALLQVVGEGILGQGFPHPPVK